MVIHLKREREKRGGGGVQFLCVKIYNKKIILHMKLSPIYLEKWRENGQGRLCMWLSVQY